MFNIKSKKTRICLAGAIISLSVLLIVFFFPNNFGDKNFSEYTQSDWHIAIVPLVIMVISLISTFVFLAILIVPLFKMSGALNDYVMNKKFSDIDDCTVLLAFDHNELKCTCYCNNMQNSLWISVKEYNLKTREWMTLEEKRYVTKDDDLTEILQKDYEYDEVTYFQKNEIK